MVGRGFYNEQRGIGFKHTHCPTDVIGEAFEADEKIAVL